jgi:hypothetical protein
LGAVLIGVLAAGVIAAAPSVASAACPKGAQCARVTVPLDHIGYDLAATSGTETGRSPGLRGGYVRNPRRQVILGGRLTIAEAGYPYLLTPRLAVRSK